MTSWRKFKKKYKKVAKRTYRCNLLNGFVGILKGTPKKMRGYSKLIVWFADFECMSESKERGADNGVVSTRHISVFNNTLLKELMGL